MFALQVKSASQEDKSSFLPSTMAQKPSLKTIDNILVQNKQPLYFIENQDMKNTGVFYFVKDGNLSVYFTTNGPNITLDEPIPKVVSNQHEQLATAKWNDPVQTEPTRKRAEVKTRFIGARPIQPKGELKTATTFSYFTHGVNASLPSYAELTYSKIWPGIDVIYSGDHGHLKANFHIQPGFSPGQINIAYQGSSNISVTEAGHLSVQTPVGSFEEDVPVAYQEINGQRKTISARYVLEQTGTNEWQYGFALGDYDPGKELVIDPILQSTYLGGSNTDDVTALAIHPLSGDIYAVGYTYSSNFPGIQGGADTVCGQCPSSTEVFVARFSSDLQTLLNVTYLGGNQNDEGRAIAIHPLTGDIYVTGSTHSTDFPGIAGGADTAYVYPWDLTEVFVSRLSFDLKTLMQSTYLGGNAIDEGAAIAIHPFSGDVYVAGQTSSVNFPGISSNSVDASCAPAPLTCSGYSPQQEGFISRLSSNLRTIYQSTYLGGTGNDSLNAVTIHPSTGDIYVTGQTRSSDFPYILGGADINCENCSRSGEPYLNEAFVTKLSSSLLNDGNVQSTYLGGRASDMGFAITVYPDTGDIYVGGLTLSYDFPAIAGGADSICGGLSCFAPPGTGGGRFEGFVSRLSSDLGINAIKQSTYLGGVTDDVVVSLAINPDTGDVYAAGSTDSSDFPGINVDSADNIIDMGADLKGDAFVSQLESSLTILKQSSYLGGSGHEENGRSIAFHPQTSDIYVAGMTNSADFPSVSGGAYEQCNNCSLAYPYSYDGFISRLDSLTVQLRYYLTVTTTGSGAVSSSPSGINCGSECVKDYTNGTLITLTATPGLGSYFSGWSGSCSGLGACNVKMDRNNEVLANFGLRAVCNLPWGGTLADGQSVIAYQNSLNSNCASTFQNRSCNNGTLSGSYLYAMCSIPAACLLPWGGTLVDGQSVTAFQSASSTNCSEITESRICTNGALSGSYSNPTCYPKDLVLDVWPPQVDFGDNLRPLSSQLITVNLTNNGLRAVRINSISKPPLPFKLKKGTCSGKTLLAGEVCTLVYQFAPKSAGDFSANISLSYGDNAVTQLVFSGAAIGPRIDSIDTDAGAGWTLSIHGQGFSTAKGKVMIGNQSAKIISWEDSHIRFALPKLKAGQYALSLSTIAKLKATTSAQMNVHAPKLASVDKNMVSANTSIVLTGEYFGVGKPMVYLMLGKFKKSVKVLSGYSDTILQIVAPQLKSGSYKVVVKSNAGSSFDEIYVNVD